MSFSVIFFFSYINTMQIYFNGVSKKLISLFFLKRKKYNNTDINISLSQTYKEEQKKHADKNQKINDRVRRKIRNLIKIAINKYLSLYVLVEH